MTNKEKALNEIFASDTLHILKDNESFNEYESRRIKYKFLINGFLGSPLTDKQIDICLDNGFDSDLIFSIGCDVYSDYKFISLFNEYYPQRIE